MLYAKRTNFNAWFVCLIAALFFFFIFIQTTAFNAINHLFSISFNATPTQTSFISSCYFIGNVLFLFPAGILIDRFSVKYIIFISMLITTIATFVFAMTHSLWIAGFARVIIGLTGAFALLSGLKIASRWFKASRMALVTGVIVTMAMIGGMISQTPLTMMSAFMGWRGAMNMVGILGAIITVLVVLLVRDYPPEAKTAITEQRQHLSNIGFWSSLGRVLVNLQNWFAGLYTSLLNLPIFLLGGSWGILYLSRIHHFKLFTASYITSMLFIGIIIGSPFWGWLSDHMGRRRRPMIIGAVLSLIVMLMIMYIPNIPAWGDMVLFLLLGFMIGAQVIGYPLITDSNTAALTGTSLAVGSTLIMAGGFTQTLFGWILGLFHGHGGYAVAMLIMPIAMIIGIIMSLLAKETFCKPLKK